MITLSRAAAFVATPLLFAYITVAPPVPSGGFHPERLGLGLVFGLFMLAVGVYVEPEDGGSGR